MIGLVDCNNFFVSCERTVRPELAERPVIVLSNNDGCAVAMSNEAKALGVTRGVPLFKIKDLVARHHIVCLPGNHLLYREISTRVMAIISVLCSDIEIYSIDEAFMHIPDDTGDLAGYGRYVVKTILRETGIPVSLGIANTKTLAKIAARFAKKHPGYQGACLIDSDPKRIRALELTAVEDVWGIGRRTAVKLHNVAIDSALQLACLPEETVKRMFAVNGQRTWRELNGQPTITDDHHHDQRKTISHSRSFATDISDTGILSEAVSEFAESVARRLRRLNCYALEIAVYIATNRFHTYAEQYTASAIRQFNEATNDTMVISAAAVEVLRSIHRHGTGIKKAGVVLTKITRREGRQLDLFSDSTKREKREKLMKAIDAINSANGPRPVVRLAASVRHEP